MDMQLFKTFLLVTKLCSITQAAEQLNFTQPAVTSQIRTLEGYFGVSLFERTGKKLKITSAGQELAKYSERLITDYNDMHKALQTFSGKTDPIILGSSTAMASYILPPILKDFQDRGIKGTVKIDICTFLSDTIKAVQDHTYDLALIHDQIDNSHLLQFELFKERLVWVALRDLVVKNDNCLDISQYPFINYLPGSVYRSKYEKIIKEKKIDTHFEYSDAQSIVSAVLDGLGVGVLPYVSVASYLADGKLIEFTTVPALTITLSIVFRKNKILSPSLRSLLSVFALRSNINNKLSEYLGS